MAYFTGSLYRATDFIPLVSGALSAARVLARKAGVPETRHEKDATSAAETLPGLVRPGDLLLIKGSRAVGLEKVVEALLHVTVEAH